MCLMMGIFHTRKLGIPGTSEKSADAFNLLPYGIAFLCREAYVLQDSLKYYVLFYFPGLQDLGSSVLDNVY